MQPINLGSTRPAPIDRSSDRRIAVTALTLALGFLAAGLMSLALPVGTRKGLWLPVHLALAGGASTAIAGMMPFFVAAFAAARPSDARLRLAGICGTALGAAGVAFGVTAVPNTSLAPAAGVVFVAGLLATAAATARPLAGSLGPSRGVVTQAYLLAVLAVVLGASIATAQVAGWPAVVDSWPRLRPAHAWLNLFGFASLVTSTTLLHFFPTVVGARIRPHPTARLTILGVGGGSMSVAAGYSMGLDMLVRLGAAAAIAGALALCLYALRIWGTRARWTTDRDWHRFSIGGLASAIAWFVAGMAIAGGRAIVFGAAPEGWSLEPIVGPLVVGWVGLAIIASATHLLPSIGPGDLATHAHQRAILGMAAMPRLIAANAGVGAITVGPMFGERPIGSVGVALFGVPFAISAVLLARAAVMGIAPLRRR